MSQQASLSLDLANPRFRRVLCWSAGLHAAVAVALVIQPRFFSSSPRLPATIEVVAVAALGVAAPPPRPQVIDEPVVIPERPKPKPKSKLVKLKSEPSAERTEPKEGLPVLTPEEILAQLRANNPHPSTKPQDQPFRLYLHMCRPRKNSGRSSP